MTFVWVYKEAGREDDGSGLLLLDLEASLCFLLLPEGVRRGSLSLSRSRSFSLSLSRSLSGFRVRTGAAEA